MIELPDMPALGGWLLDQRRLVGSPAYVLAEFHHCVVMATVDGTAVTWSPEAPPLHPRHLVDLRVFGAAGECHIWRAHDGTFASRERSDRPGEPGAHDEQHALWGSRAERTPGAPGWCAISEERGIRYCLPLPLAGPLRGDAVPRLTVRHYRARDPETGLVYVQDWRLVDLTPGAREEA